MLRFLLFWIIIVPAGLLTASDNIRETKNDIKTENIGTEDFSSDDALGMFTAEVLCELAIRHESGDEKIELGDLKPNSSKMLPYSARLVWSIEGDDGTYFEASAFSYMYANESENVYLSGTLWGVDTEKGEEILDNNFQENISLPSLNSGKNEGVEAKSCNGAVRLIFIPKRIVAKKLAEYGGYTFNLNINVDNLLWSKPLE